MVKPRNKSTSIYTSVECDRRGRWYPVLEVRRNGALVYAVTHYEAFVSPVRCAKRALELVSAVS